MAAGRGNSRAKNEIIELLKEDHQRVKKAFKTAEKLYSQEQHEELQALVEQTCAEVQVHAQLEEEIFYPACREAVKDEDLIEEAEVEHGSAKALMLQLEGMSPEDPKYFATFKVLGEYLKHHIKEEESELFEQLTTGRSKIAWEDLQQQMLTMRETLMAEMGLAEEEGEEQEESQPAPRSRGGRNRSEQPADQEETVE
ncbi:MAG: hemerythrin domain-containing protein [Burkholderiaceae bacterium]